MATAILSTLFSRRMRLGMYYHPSFVRQVTSKNSEKKKSACLYQCLSVTIPTSKMNIDIQVEIERERERKKYPDQIGQARAVARLWPHNELVSICLG